MQADRPHVRRRALHCDDSFQERVIEERRRLGIDRWDELWDGDLHMVPPPHEGHDWLDFKLTVFLGNLIEEQDLGRLVYLAVRDPAKGEKDYRIPDRCFVSKARGVVLRHIERDGRGVLEVSLGRDRDRRVET